MYNVGSTAIVGWTVVGGSNVQLVDKDYFASSGYTLNASDLRQWVDLTGGNEGFGKGVETTFVGTAGNYVLTFDLGRLLSRTPASVEVVIDGVSTTRTNSGAAGGNVMDWKSFSVPFVSDGSTTITFLGSAVSGGNNGLIGLDNVAVVPEPGTYAMLLAGLAAVGFVARRRSV